MFAVYNYPQYSNSGLVGRMGLWGGTLWVGLTRWGHRMTTRWTLPLPQRSGPRQGRGWMGEPKVPILRVLFNKKPPYQTATLRVSEKRKLKCSFSGGFLKKWSVNKTLQHIFNITPIKLAGTSRCWTDRAVPYAHCLLLSSVFLVQPAGMHRPNFYLYLPV